jgi:DNA replication and repair protein RecF
LKSLRTYERALRSRNSLLKEGRPSREVQAFDPILIAHGNALTASRAMATELLSPLIQSAVHEIGGARDTVNICYESGGELGTALTATRMEELRLRQTVVGPHRDDLTIDLNAMSAGKFASEGQQRTVALALKLAQTRLIIAQSGAIPILLIDDVFGELDIARRTNLLAGLPAHAQTLITTTHLNWLTEPMSAAIFQLSDHSLTPASG